MNRAISGKTAVCALIGDPVEHTMSPAMHNAAFRKLGLDYRYVAFRVKPDGLSQAISGVRALNIRGLNITIPHKVTVMPLLDKIDPLAEKIGAVNTIVNDDGILTGYNTDATGFLRALWDKGVEPEGKRAVVLGAGGAARAIAFVLAENGAALSILNRELEMDWAEALAQRIARAFHKKVKALRLDEKNLGSALKGADILVNATSVGMAPFIEETPVPARLLRPLTVFDAVYNPSQTRLLREAGVVGALTIGGLDMLVGQGALAFEKWTGRPAPVELMREEAIKSLKAQER